MIEARMLRFAAAGLGLAANLCVFRAGEGRLAARIGANAALAQQVREAQQVLTSRPMLEVERQRLHAQLRRVNPDGDRSSLMARFIHAASRIALANRTRIPSMTASGSPNPSAATAPMAIPLELIVEGRYADVLATIRGLSNASVLATVDVASLARKTAEGGDATVVATLRVLLERISPPARVDARARPA